jgi:hypothetical protein
MSSYHDPVDALRSARELLADNGRTAADKERRATLVKRIDDILANAKKPSLRERRLVAAEQAIGRYNFDGFPVETQSTFTNKYGGKIWDDRLLADMMMEDDSGGRLRSISAYFEVIFAADSDWILNCACRRVSNGRKIGKWPTPGRKKK